MTLLVLGATDANPRQIEALASARALRVVTAWTSARPAWVLAASPATRREALSRYRLPAFRVVEHPALARDGALDADVLRTGLARMAEIGADEPALSPAGVSFARRLMPWIARALERWLGGDAPDQEDVLSRKAERIAEKASRREAVLREQPRKERTPEETQQRAEQKAARKAARRAEKPSVVDPPRGPRVA